MLNKQIFHMWTIILSTLWATSLINAEGVRCGRPGRPVNGTLSPPGGSYFPGEKVSYGCLEGFVLFGDEGRTCLKDGTWEGDVPLCDFNLAKGKKNLQSATLWSYTPDLAVDGNPDTCSFTPRGPEPRWWQVHLGHKFNVLAIGVTISPGSFQEFTIYVIELLADNKALYKPCTTFKGVFQTHKGLFKCNSGLGHPGQFVYIRDDRREEEYFGLCEVEVFAFRERIPCGDPEVPVNGDATREGEDRTNYSCKSGFRLQGDATLTCSSKGKWQGQTPKCTEVHCSPPAHISNGYIEIGHPKKEFPFGTEVHYGCSPGYVLQGPSTRVCNDTGLWSGEDPKCNAVNCGEPPSFSHAKNTLINGSSQWAGIAVYTCEEGYRLLPGTVDTVTTCLDIGEWRFINITCVSMALLPPEREGIGRSLDYKTSDSFGQESASTSHLIIALAAVAGVLSAAMILVGVLLVRRRLLSGPPGSLSPLVGGTNTPPDKGTAYFLHGLARVPSQESSGSPDTATASMFRRPQHTHFEANLLQGLHPTQSEEHSTLESNIEPPYERIRSRSEHSYETLRKKNSRNGLDDPGYEAVADRSCGKDPGYEIVTDGKEVGYETVQGKDHQYETLKNKEPGYETVKDASDPGYEIVKEGKPFHGYETLKPKPPPPRLQMEDDAKTSDDFVDASKDQTECDTLTSEENIQHIPDVLRGLHSLDIEECSNDKEVSPEILAMYAKVNKNRKSKIAASDGHVPLKETLSDSVLPSSTSESAVEGVQRRASDGTDGSRLANAAKDLIRKFNGLASPHQEGIMRGRGGSLKVEEGRCSPRPLPPLPHQVKNT